LRESRTVNVKRGLRGTKGPLKGLEQMIFPEFEVSTQRCSHIAAGLVGWGDFH
jgi:hypothetical protein